MLVLILTVELDDKRNADDFTMKIILISGTTGTGKSHFLSYLWRELINMSSIRNGKMGFEIFLGQGQHRSSSSPFQIWISVVKSILMLPARASTKVELVRKLKNSFDGSRSVRSASKYILL